MGKTPARKAPISGIVGQVSVFSDIHDLPPSLPDHIGLPDGALPYWETIISSRSNRDWRIAPTLLATAANLARVQYQIDQIGRAMEAKEEYQGMKGQILQQVLLKTMALENSYLRALRQTGVQSWVGENVEDAKRRAVVQEIRDTNPVRFSDGLLASPKR